MKKTFAKILFCLLSVNPVLAQTNAAAENQSRTVSIAYSVALERWQRALSSRDLSIFSFTPYFGHPSDASPALKELNESVKELSSFGANMIPWMVEQIRGDLSTTSNVAATSFIGLDTNSVKHQATVSGRGLGQLDRDVQLLFMLGGIQVGIGTSGFYSAKMSEVVRSFLKEWDAGVFTNLEETLRKIRDDNNEDVTVEKVDYKKTFPYRRYGVYRASLRTFRSLGIG